MYLNLIIIFFSWLTIMSLIIAVLSNKKDRAKNVITFNFGILDRSPITSISKVFTRKSNSNRQEKESGS